MYPDKDKHGPLSGYVKLRVAHAPGMPGTFSPPPWISDPGMHHGMCITHVPWCMPRSLISGFLWSRWRGKRSRRSRRMRNPQFYISGKRPIDNSCSWLEVIATFAFLFPVDPVVDIYSSNAPVHYPIDEQATYLTDLYCSVDFVAGTPDFTIEYASGPKAVDVIHETTNAMPSNRFGVCPQCYYEVTRVWRCHMHSDWRSRRLRCYEIYYQ